MQSFPPNLKYVATLPKKRKFEFVRYHYRHIVFRVIKMKHFIAYGSVDINTGRSPVRAEGPAGCGHSKIARVCAYYLYVLYVVAAAD